MKINTEIIVMGLIVAILLFIGPGVLMDHQLKHDFPYGYSASDAFQHQIRAESIKEMGNFRYEAPYIAVGLEGTVGRYPPILYHLAVIVGEASGLETYDSIILVILIFMVLAVMLMFLITKEFNKYIAFFSIPLAFLLFSSPLIGGLRWGHWPSLLGQAFLILFFWAVMRRDLPSSWVLLGVSLSAIALTHTAQGIFAVLFLTLFFLVLLVFKKVRKEDIKNAFLMGILFLIVSFYYLIIFKNTWAKGGGGISLGTSLPFWDGGPGFYVSMFGLLLLPLLVGSIFSFFQMRRAQVALVLAWAMLIAGFLNYVGFSFRSFQVRFFWPLYLSVFFGLGIYMIGKLAMKKWKPIPALSMLGITSVLLLGFFPVANSLNTVNPQEFSLSKIMSGVAQYNGKSTSGMMNPYHWQTFSWIAENTPPDAIIYFFYGDIYNQDATLRNSKRVHHQVNIDDFVQAIQERKIRREYMTEVPGDTGGGISYRKSFFTFERAFEKLPEDYQFQKRDICAYDYFVFDKVSGQQVLAQYNLFIAQELVQRNSTTPLFQNEVAIILKNEKKGGECIEEKDF